MLTRPLWYAGTATGVLRDKQALVRAHISSIANVSKRIPSRISTSPPVPVQCPGVSSLPSASQYTLRKTFAITFRSSYLKESNSTS